MTTSLLNLRDSRSTISPASGLFPGPRAFTLAFTLIELLVVISIIAVLTALSVPVYSKVMLSGKQAKTVSRLRDLQRANIQYSADNDGIYVPYQETGYVAASNGDSRKDPAWIENPKFMELLGVNSWKHWWGNPPEAFCSALIPYSVSKGMAASFGFNSEALTSQPPYWPPAKRRTSTVASLSRLMAFGESQDMRLLSGGATKYSLPEKWSGDTIAYRYNNMANVVFFDGHVEQLTKDKVVGNDMLWRGEQP